MAFDQVSLFLYPPRWRQQSVEDRKMKYYRGGFVRIVSAVRKADSEGAVVMMGAVCDWLASKGFVASHDGPSYEMYKNGTVESAIGPRQEIEISVSAEGEEVSSLYCRFSLTPDSPNRLEKWESFVHNLCGEFALGIGVTDGEVVGPECFLELIRRADNWRCFVEQLGWRGGD